jgi:hypothetical protein
VLDRLLAGKRVREDLIDWALQMTGDLQREDARGGGCEARGDVFLGDQHHGVLRGKKIPQKREWGSRDDGRIDPSI